MHFCSRNDTTTPFKYTCAQNVFRPGSTPVFWLVGSRRSLNFAEGSGRIERLKRGELVRRRGVPAADIVVAGKRQSAERSSEAATDRPATLLIFLHFFFFSKQMFNSRFYVCVLFMLLKRSRKITFDTIVYRMLGYLQSRNYQAGSHHLIDQI